MSIKKFPFTRQPDAMDCGPACIGMIAKHYGKEYDINGLRNNSYISREGVSLLGISRAAENIGFRTLGGRITFKMLAEKALLPCIVHWRQDHFVVVYAIKKSKKNGYDVYVADPGKGRMRFTQDDFCENWISTQTGGEEKGVALLFEPTALFYEKEGDAIKKENRLKFLWKYLVKYKRFFTQLILDCF